MQFADLKENSKIIIMAALFSGACLLTYYYHAILDTDVIFTHLFYIPIVLASIWWKRRGIAVAVLLVLLLVVSHVLFTPDLSLIPDLCRAAMFVVVAFAVALLSEQTAVAGLLYKSLAGNSHTGVYILQDGKLQYVNQHAIEYGGFSEDELLQMSPLEWIHPDDREEAQKNAIRMLKGVRKAPYEFRLITGDGKIKWILETVTPIQFKGRKAVLGNAMDITGRKEKEDILKQYRTRMKLILDSVGDGIYGVDVHGNTTFVNPSAAELTGYSAKEMIGRDLHEMIHHSKPDGTPYPSDACKVHMTVKDGVSRRVVDEVFWKKNNKSFFVEYIVTPILEKESIAGAVIVFRDITERKRAEEYVKNTNQRFSETLNSLDALVYVTDMRTHELLFINKYGQDIWGDIEGKICWQTIQEGRDGPCEFCTNDRLVDADGKPTGVLVWEFQNTVNKRWYECRDRAIYWPDGRVVRIEIASDITERKQAEEALRQSEEKYRLIFENALEGIYQTTPDGRFISANPALAEIFGYDSPESIIREVSNIGQQLYLEPSQRQEFLNLLNQQGFVRNYECEGLRKDGNRLFASITTRVVKDNKGKILYLEGILNNITERRQLESKLSQARKMESLGQLSSGAAHEIRNPLNIMSLLLQMPKAVGKPVDEDAQKVIDSCQTQIKRITLILDGLYEFSRMPQTEKARNDLNKIIEEVVASQDERFKNEGITPEIRYGEDIPSFMLDKDKIATVITHMVSNAVDAMKNQETKKVGISTEKTPTGESVRIIISDTGHGIKEKDKSRIFDPFFTTKDPDKGKGLGLAVAYGIIRDHGGTIQVENNAEGGATFFIELPVGGKIGIMTIS